MLRRNFEKLNSIGQIFLLENSPENPLDAQIDALDIEVFKKQRALWEKRLSQKKPLTKGPSMKEPFDLWTSYTLAGSKEDRTLGQELLRKGKMGCIVLAGGRGDRLGAREPKGTLPISCVEGKSHFQIIAEKTLAMSHRVGCELPLAIMTSPSNHEATRQFFKNHQNFGLKKITFFSQKELPLLDDRGNLFLREGKIASGPNGNGEVFQNFCQAGVWDKWKAQGVEYLNIILIDNPLADPFDAELLGFTKRKKTNLTVKGIFAKEAEIGVGILISKGGKMGVIEYSESEGKVPEKALGSLSLYCVSMELAKEVSKKGLLLHMVERKGWKFETFIFDLWESGEVLIYPAEACFAPYKRKVGPGDLASVQKKLQHWDQKCLEKLGKPVSKIPFELSADLYYEALSIA